MRTGFLIILAASLAAAQGTPAPAATQVSGDTVVAVLNGRKFTADQIRALVAGSPKPVQVYFQQNPKQFLQEHAYYLALMEYAEKNKLDTQSPYKEALEFSRLNVLVNAALNYSLSNTGVTPEEQKKYYDAHPADFREAKVRMIYVPFADAGKEKEEEVQKKAASLSARARSGEDFTKLAAEAGSDAAEFTVRKDSSQPPPAMKEVILNQKAGAITEPLRHENGYYVFRIESIGVLPYEQVRDDIYKLVQNERWMAWQEKTRSQTSAQFENEAFFQNIGKQ